MKPNRYRPPDPRAQPVMPASRRHRRIAWLVAVCLAFVVAGTLSGWGRQIDPPRGQGDPAARTAIRHLAVAPGRPHTLARRARSIPAAFVRELGYRPRVERADGRAELVNPHGGCSSPFGATTYDFDLACKHHDLGYDVLRFATREGHPLGQWARDAVDARFADDLYRRCDQVAAASRIRGAGCRLSAAAYVAAVDLNSWRQGWGTPIVERPAPWVAGGVMGLAVLVTVGSAPRVVAAAAAATRPHPVYQHAD
jgi:hypothetical protein